MKTDDPIFDWLKNPLNDLRLVLMRGLPSCGKSYKANEIAGGDDSIIFSADKFFGKTCEEYVQNWNLQKLFVAHKVCKKGAKMAMQRRAPLVIIDNTNTVMRELSPYFDLAVQYGYKVEIEEPTSSWWVNDIAPYLLDKPKYKKELEKACEFLAEKSKKTHCVPLSSIQKMMARYQPMINFQDLVNSFCKRYPDGKITEEE